MVRNRIVNLTKSKVENFIYSDNDNRTLISARDITTGCIHIYLIVKKQAKIYKKTDWSYYWTEVDNYEDYIVLKYLLKIAKGRKK